MKERPKIASSSPVHRLVLVRDEAWWCCCSRSCQSSCASTAALELSQSSTAPQSTRFVLQTSWESKWEKQTIPALDCAKTAEWRRTAVRMCFGNIDVGGNIVAVIEMAIINIMRDISGKLMGCSLDLTKVLGQLSTKGKKKHKQSSRRGRCLCRRGRGLLPRDAKPKADEAGVGRESSRPYKQGEVKLIDTSVVRVVFAKCPIAKLRATNLVQKPSKKQNGGG